jgi:uracil-DNA glycosylase family 4
MRLPIMIVGLNPSKTGHNESGIPFRTRAGKVTPSGRPLLVALEELGVRLEDLYFTELTKCHAPDNQPTSGEIANCKAYITREINLLQPRAIVALGATVAQELAAVCAKGNSKVVAIKHPSYVQRFLTRRRGYYRSALGKVLKMAVIKLRRPR